MPNFEGTVYQKYKGTQTYYNYENGNYRGFAHLILLLLADLLTYIWNKVSLI